MMGIVTALLLVLLALPAQAAQRSIVSATIGATSAQAVAAAPGGQRVFLSIDNESTTATIACSFGGTAAINTAGSYTIPPGNTRTWTAPSANTYPLNPSAINCIATAGSTPATIEVVQ